MYEMRRIGGKDKNAIPSLTSEKGVSHVNM